MVEVNLFSSLLLVFLFAVLFFRKSNSLPNRLLGLVFLLPGFNFIVNILILTNIIDYCPWVFFLFQITGALFAPVTYYYINSLTAHKTNAVDRVLFSVSMLIICAIIYIGTSFYLLNPAEQADYLAGMKHGPYPKDMEYYSTAVFAHQLLYFTFNFIEVRRYRLQMEQQTSNLIKAKVGYLYRFTVLLWLLTLVTVVLYVIVDETIYVEYISLPIALVVCFFFILYYAFNEHAIFTEREYQKHIGIINELEELAQTPKEEASFEELNIPNLPDLATLKQTIYQKEWFKDPDFNISNLSSHLDKPVYKISSTLKDGGTTFYELIRKIRVEKAKELLQDNDINFSIEGIALEVGFKSRASFYRAFKKYENTNPTDIAKRRPTDFLEKA